GRRGGGRRGLNLFGLGRRGGLARTAKHTAALHLDHHRIAAAVAELLLHLSGLDRPLQPERLAAKGRLVLFVTHRKPSFLQNASETAEAADVSPVPGVREFLFETRSAASLLHPVKNCQRLKCAST